MGDRTDLKQTVPTLPLFIDESNCQINNLISNSGPQAKEILIPANSSRHHDLRKYRRKGRRCTNHSCERCKSNMKEEVLVHTARSKHHYHHRRKGSSHNRLQTGNQISITENKKVYVDPVPTAGEQSTSEILDTLSQDDTAQENLCGNSIAQNIDIPQNVLLVELDKLRVINNELKRQLQANLSSADSGCQPSAEDVLKLKEEEVKHLQLNILQLDKLQNDLQKQRNTLKLQLDNASGKEQNPIDTNSIKVKELESQNKILVDDVKLLKELVCKYNSELANYQEKLGKKKANYATSPNIDNQEADGHLAWEKINKETLRPLLIAYSETIQEKNDLIQELEENHKKSINNCKALAEENAKLYHELEELKMKNEELETQWNVLKEDSTITQEHNELLTTQLETQKEKIQEMHSAFQQKVTGISKDLEDVYSKYHTCRGDLLTLQGRYTVLREEYDKLKNESQSKIPYTVHSESVGECRKLFEDLKLKYELDKKEMAVKIAELEAEKPQLEGRTAALKSENEQLHLRLQSTEKVCKKTRVRCDGLHGKLVAAQVSRDTAKRQLQKAMAFAEELVGEQERLLKQLHQKQEESRSIARLGSTIVYRMGSLRTKLKNVQEGAWQELDVIEKRIQKQEAGVDHMKKEYNQEVARLRNLVKQKETIIGRLQKEKSKTEENLEVVWRAATSEDIHIKETLKHVNFPANPSQIKFFRANESSNSSI